METYYGFVRTPLDAIILFEACRLGLLPRVQRRLSEKERNSIRSGSVFCWDEREAGMRRWTDGKSWSASRVSGSFLTYREMVGKQPKTGDENSNTSTDDASSNNNTNNNNNTNRHFDSDGFVYKPDGLMKQSFSITTTTNLKLHLISYFSRQHASSNELQLPSQDVSLKNIVIPKGLYPDSSATPIEHSPPVAHHHANTMIHPMYNGTTNSSPSSQIEQAHYQRNPYMAPPAQLMHPLQPPPPTTSMNNNNNKSLAAQPHPPSTHHQQQYNHYTHTHSQSMPINIQQQPNYHHPHSQYVNTLPVSPPHEPQGHGAAPMGGNAAPAPAPAPAGMRPHYYESGAQALTPLGSSSARPNPNAAAATPHHLMANTIAGTPSPPHLPSLPPPSNHPGGGQQQHNRSMSVSSSTLNAQDIPYEKVAFKEDQRAIQVLDRRFNF